jgi:hypothetical protein
MYQVKISNRFSALENSDDGWNISRAWENVRKDMKISAKESAGHYKRTQHKPWYDEESSDF